MEDHHHPFELVEQAKKFKSFVNMQIEKIQGFQVENVEDSVSDRLNLIYYGGSVTWKIMFYPSLFLWIIDNIFYPEKFIQWKQLGRPTSNKIEAQNARI